MLVVTTEQIPGVNYQVVGVVHASSVMTKHLGTDFMQGLKNMVGGELEGYVKMMNEARNNASNRVIQQAQQMGADAIVGLRYSSSAVMQGAAEVLAYGTAVKIINN